MVKYKYKYKYKFFTDFYGFSCQEAYGSDLNFIFVNRLFGVDSRRVFTFHTWGLIGSLEFLSMFVPLQFFSVRWLRGQGS